ncbi:MAG: hypothetical protein ACQ9MH_15670 [Nitrospinales bacterium]
MMKSLVSTFILAALLPIKLNANEISGRTKGNLQTSQPMVSCVKADHPEDGEEEDEVCIESSPRELPPPPGFEGVLKFCGNSDTPQWEEECYYEIGDTGPAGGIVFYVTDGGLHGLEVARVDQDHNINGSCFGRNTGATGYGIGTGASNTIALLKADCGWGSVVPAASYEVNGYNGWFLPSIGELLQLELQKEVVGMTREFYWSSTELDRTVVWTQNFFHGFQYNKDKRSRMRVRAIRAF